MGDPFVHLRVASGYSLQYGASHPSALVEAAAGFEMDTLAITDRGGLYGAVRFAKACLGAGIAPIVGVDLALAGERAGAPSAGRVVALATSRRGCASLCRLTSAVHLGGERGRPRVTRGQIGAHRDDVVVMLGADSDLGRALAERDDARAEAVLRRWLEVVDRESLVVGVTHHRVAGAGPWSAGHAGRMLAFADARGLAGVLTNAVRMARRTDAPVADVLDATRRLVPLDLRNVDRRNAEGYLKSGKEMVAIADEVCRLAGRRDAVRLFGDTRHLAVRCRLDPRADLGLGEIHLPEFEVLQGSGDAFAELRRRCEAGLAARYGSVDARARDRIDDELAVVGELGFSPYFLTVAQVVDGVRELGVRVAARGSGAGSLINYALGISGVDPLRYDLIMERFLSPLRVALPDIDIDVESARRTDVYDMIFAMFGRERVACVAMMETYRVRHAIRDVGKAMSLPPGDVDAIAKSFPHIRARDVRHALRDLPELRSANLADEQLRVLFDLVESLDGLPRHVALHPCGVLLSDATLYDRTPVEASFGDYPMSQFDKDDVEDIGLLKLDVLGIRMQSSMAHAVAEIERVEGERVDLDALAPFDDPAVYAMIGRAETIGCFQIESPGQRELVGKFGPSDFTDIVIDISLFRPGPVKSDMVIPFLRARNGWAEPRYLHPDLVPALAETRGVVVFHEQVIKLVAVMTGCSLAYGDEARRALGSPQGQEDVRRWFVPAALAKGYDPALVDEVWQVLVSFASFGFCKAHAAAFALPTYQSAWLKVYYPAHFVAGLLTHDPGMYPKRLILEEARRLCLPVLPLDVNHSRVEYVVEPVGAERGIRLALADVKGIASDELTRIVAGQPYAGLVDFWRRAAVSIDVAERLVLAGAFDELYGVGLPGPVAARGAVTRRDLMLALADLAREARVDQRVNGRRARGLGGGASGDRQAVQLALDFTAPAPPGGPGGTGEGGGPLDADGVGEEGAGAAWASGVPGDVAVTGLPEMTASERMAAELDILGMDATRHVLSDYREFLAAIGVTWSSELLERRSRSSLLVAGVKVATQTPPVRSGRRVIFLTLDDTTGPVDLTFFEDAQGPYARTVFNSWLVVGRGELRRTGPRGVSLRATGAWELTHLHGVWAQVLEATGDAEAAVAAVRAIIDAPAEMPEHDPTAPEASEGDGRASDEPVADPQRHGRGGGMGQRRVFLHASGFVQSPYTDVRPAGPAPASVPAEFTEPGRKLWHSSPGSSGR